jgi:hypothetical protein
MGNLEWDDLGTPIEYNGKPCGRSYDFDEFEELCNRSNVATGARAGRFKLERFCDIEFDEGNEWLVEGIIPQHGCVGIIGDSGSGKTHVVAALNYSVATGTPWAGKAVRKNVAIYVTGEGVNGYRKRIKAQRQRFGEADIPYYLISESPNLGSADGDAQLLIARIREQVSGSVGLVTLDTIARSMGPGDENSVRDIMQFMANAEMIGRALGCVVVVVHHIGKDLSRGARGSSALKAALDAEILVQGLDGERTMTVTKAKDGEAGLIAKFVLDVVDISRSSDRRVTSCVVRFTQNWQSGADAAKPADNLASPLRIALEALQLAIDGAGEPPPTGSRINRTNRVVPLDLWRRYAEQVQIAKTDKPDSKRKAFNRAAEKLQALKKIGISNDYVWLI